MKILVATSNFFEPISQMFKGHDVSVLPKDYGKDGEKPVCDLLVLSGGEDVLPSYYGEAVPNSGWFNPERDKHEFGVLRNRLFSKTKILGICRGMQVLNVF